jgi:hypothetical protein
MIPKLSLALIAAALFVTVAEAQTLNWSCAFSWSGMTRSWSGTRPLNYCSGSYQTDPCEVWGGGSLLVNHMKDNIYECTVFLGHRAKTEPGGLLRFTSIALGGSDAYPFQVSGQCVDYMGGTKPGITVGTSSSSQYFRNHEATTIMASTTDGGYLSCDLKFNLPASAFPSPSPSPAAAPQAAK